ncbi:hypothetical protein ACWU37_16645 [Photobacterium damselae subsp. damselae]
MPIEEIIFLMGGRISARKQLASGREVISCTGPLELKENQYPFIVSAIEDGIRHLYCAIKINSTVVYWPWEASDEQP